MTKKVIAAAFFALQFVDVFAFGLPKIDAGALAEQAQKQAIEQVSNSVKKEISKQTEKLAGDVLENKIAEFIASNSEQIGAAGANLQAGDIKQSAKKVRMVAQKQFKREFKNISAKMLSSINLTQYINSYKSDIINSATDKNKLEKIIGNIKNDIVGKLGGQVTAAASSLTEGLLDANKIAAMLNDNSPLEAGDDDEAIATVEKTNYSKEPIPEGVGTWCYAVKCKK